MSLSIVWHPDYVAPLRPRHPFPMSKYYYLRRALEARGLMPPGGFLAPVAAGEAELSAVHAPDYVARVLSCAMTRAEEKAVGLPSSPAVARRGRLSSAGTLLAARLAMETGAACNAAGGSHHAGPAGGAGYCVFNDVAVAAQALLDRGAARRIMVVDLDVHQGDGTARIFAADPRVFTLSVHAARNYPAEKAVSTLDVPLDDGLTDTAYLRAVEKALNRALADFRPDLAFYNAGVDVWEGDRLGRLSVSLGGLRARDRLVLRRLRAAGIPVCGVLGGGYSHDPEELAARHAILFEEAAAL